MRVLIVFNDYLEAGGERNSVRGTVQALANLGVECRLASVGNEFVATAGLGTKVAISVGQSVLLNYLEEELANFSPDIVHLENSFPLLGPSFGSLIDKVPLPWVRTIRNFRDTCIEGTRTRQQSACTACSRANLYLPGVRYRCYRGSTIQSVGATLSREATLKRLKRRPPSSVIFPSKFLRETYGIGRTTVPRSTVIGNPVSFPPESSHVAWRERAFDCVYVGRLSEQKGFGTFLGILAAMPECKFAVAGSGPLRNHIENLTANFGNVTYFGELTETATLNLLSQSRLVIVPSRVDETFGRVPVEAISVGAIPVISNRGALPEIAQTLNLGGFVVHEILPEAWVARISELLSHPEASINNVVRGAYDLACKNFSYETIGKQLVAEYELALRDAPG